MNQINSESETLNQRMVADLVRMGAIRTEAVRDAFLNCPRHLFLPADRKLEEVYDSRGAHIVSVEGAAPTGSTDPQLLAIWLELAAPRKGQRVLEIGAGTGWAAGLLARMVGVQGHVLTLDIDEGLCSMARENLRRVGARNVTVEYGDGFFGCLAFQPFHVIAASCAVVGIPEPWVEQLTSDGRVVVPLQAGAAATVLVAFQSREFAGERYLVPNFGSEPCQFIPMR